MALPVAQLIRLLRSLLPGILRLLLALLLPTVYLVQPAAGSPDAGELRIAAVFSESGIAAPHNKPLIEMTKLAVDKINENGGILGKQVRLLLLDNLSTPIGSAMAARKCVEQQVAAVIGAHWSSHSLAMAPILEEAAIPMISPGSTNPDVTKGRNYIFRTCFIDSFQGLAMAKFAYNNLQARSAVVATAIDEDYSTVLGQFFSRAFEKAGGRVLEEIGYRGSATDFSENIRKILEGRPDVVYLPGYTRDSGLFIKQAVKMGVQATFLGGDAWDEIETYAGAAVAGSFQSAPWHPEVPYSASEEMKQFFKDVYGREIANNSSPLAYDAVMLLADAITRAGSTDRQAIRDALATTRDFRGATGSITFDGSGDPLDKGIIIIEFKDGQRVFKETIQPEP